MIALALWLLLSQAPVYAETANPKIINVHDDEPDDECDAEEDRKALAASAACEKRKDKSKRHWKKLDEAKSDVLKLLRAKKTDALWDYVACDAGDSSQLEILCTVDAYRTIDRADLEKIVRLAGSGEGALDGGSWIKYGTRHNLWLYCAPKFPFLAGKNYCGEDGKRQPVIELRQDKDRVVISGVPLTGIEPKPKPPK